MIEIIEKVIEFLKMHSCNILKIHYINDTKILRINDITLSYAYQDKYYKCFLVLKLQQLQLIKQFHHYQLW